MKRNTTLILIALICLLTIPSVAHGRYRDGMNLYQYVESRPTTHVDPNGEASMSIDVLPGWYKIKTKGAIGRTWICIKVETDPCECPEKNKKWNIPKVDLEVKLFISLKPKAKTKHTRDEVFGHEQRHVKMMKKSLEFYRKKIETKLGKWEKKKYKSEKKCEKIRKSKKISNDILRLLNKTVRAKNPQAGFFHARNETEEKMGHPINKEPYDPSEPAGKSRGDGNPLLEKKDGWRCSKKK